MLLYNFEKEKKTAVHATITVCLWLYPCLSRVYEFFVVAVTRFVFRIFAGDHLQPPYSLHSNSSICPDCFLVFVCLFLVYCPLKKEGGPGMFKGCLAMHLVSWMHSLTATAPSEGSKHQQSVGLYCGSSKQKRMRFFFSIF